MNPILKNTLIIGGTVVATTLVANMLTDGAVMDAIKDKLHMGAETVQEATQAASDAVNEAAAAAQ